METIKNATEGIYPFQQALYQKALSGGFKPSEMVLYSAGRQTGKSMYYSKMFKNLCNEIILPGYPKTSASLNRLMPKYQFSRANWYVAEFDWVHHAEVLEWCTKQFGPHPQRPDAWSRWQNKYSERIHFAYEKDYEWFLLRWGV